MIKMLARGFAVIGLAVGLVACVPEFDNMLVGGDKADAALSGEWIGRSTPTETPMPIAITPEGEGIALVLTDDSKDKTKPEQMHFVGTTALVAGVHYVSLKPIDPDVPPGTGYLIFKYEPQADGTVKVWHMDDKTVLAAVEAGTLKGTVEGEGDGKTAKVSASADELAAYFATPEAQAGFSSGTGDVLVLTKAKP